MSDTENNQTIEVTGYFDQGKTRHVSLTDIAAITMKRFEDSRPPAVQVRTTDGAQYSLARGGAQEIGARMDKSGLPFCFATQAGSIKTSHVLNLNHTQAIEPENASDLAQVTVSGLGKKDVFYPLDKARTPMTHGEYLQALGRN